MTFIPQFSSYNVLKQIGEGGMAKVYLAEHKILGHQVAIKVLSKEFSHNKNIRSRFIDEAKKMVRMNHSNVVKVSDLIDDKDTVAIVMEFADGKTLAEIIATHKLTDSEIKLYLNQMLKALEYVHAQGLIHRDIKPSNFILGKDGCLKLTDFGISKSLLSNSEHTQTSTTMSMGTPMYMSPEQVRSTKDVSHLTDIFSLGVVLWQLATGIKPYDSRTISGYDLNKKIVEEDLPLTGTNWDRVIQKATQKEEKKRYQSANEFLLALDTSISSMQVDEKEGSVPDFERTIVTQKPVFNKTVKEIENGSDTAINKIRKWKIYSILLLLIGTIIIWFILKPISNNLKTNELFGRVKSVKVKHHFDDTETKTYEIFFDSEGGVIKSFVDSTYWDADAKKTYCYYKNNKVVKKVKTEEQKGVYYVNYGEQTQTNLVYTYYNSRGDIDKTIDSNYYDNVYMGDNVTIWLYDNTYNDVGQLIVQTRSCGAVWRTLFKYDQKGNLIEEADWLDSILDNNNIWRKRSELYSKTKYFYDTKNNLIRKYFYDEDGFYRSLLYEYDDQDNLREETDKHIIDKETYLTIEIYDENYGLISKRRFKNGKLRDGLLNDQTYKYKYNDLGLVLQEVISGGLERYFEFEYEYDDHNNWIKKFRKRDDDLDEDGNMNRILTNTRTITYY